MGLGWNKARVEAKRSPLPRRSLPHAGESLQEELWRRRADLLFWGLVPLLFLMQMLRDWLQYWWKTPPTPWFSTTLFAGAVVVAAWRWRVVTCGMAPLRLAARGERVVGEVLEGLRQKGYRVFHDIEEDGYNIDHVIVGPNGVFAIETKTVSKRSRGNPKVVFDGQKVLVDGIAPDRDPVAQCKAAARRVRAIIREMTGRDAWVKPVVLYPAWWVESSPGADVYVANEKFFAMSFDREHARQVLAREDIEVIAAGLDRYLRRDRVDG